ncbi:MAG: phage holin family protein [Caldilineaceae bacterium]
MARILVQVVVNAIALYVAAGIVDGAEMSTDLVTVLIVGLIFGGLNTLVRPILSLLTCPFYVLTLGLFTFVMNVFILWMLEWISDRFLGASAVNFGDFWSTLMVGIIVSIVSFALNMLLGGNRER